MYVISTVLPQWHINCSIVKLNIWHHVPEQTLKSWNKNINRESLIHYHEKSPEYRFVFNTHGQSAFQVSEGFPFSPQYCWSPGINIEARLAIQSKAIRMVSETALGLWVCGYSPHICTFTATSDEIHSQISIKKTSMLCFKLSGTRSVSQ